MVTKSVSDGMDLSICSFDFKNNTCFFSGANNVGLFVHHGELIVLEADRCSIGGYWHSHLKEFTRKVFKFEKGDRIYLFTDGFLDQFGGENGKKFTKRRFMRLIADVQQYPMKSQNEIILNTFNEWIGNEMQVDDVSVIGIEL